MHDDDESPSPNSGLDYLLLGIDQVNGLKKLRKILFLCIAIELVLLLGVVFFSPHIYEFFASLLEPGESGDDEGSPIGIILFVVVVLPFLIGFLICYSVLVLRRPDVESSRKIESGFGAGYGYMVNEMQKSRMYMISGAVGAVNLIVVLILLFGLS